MSLYDLYQKYKRRYKHLKRIEANKNIILYESRIKTLDELHDSNKLNKNDCNIFYNDKDEGSIDSKRYKYVTKGGQGAIYFLSFDNYNIALKFVVLNPPLHKKWRELYVLQNCTKFVKSKITQNLPILYKHQTCRKGSNKTLMLYSELADGDLLKWLRFQHSVEDWKSMLFQVWHALYVLQTRLKLVHNDLRLPNILYFDNQKSGNYKYVMDNDEYYLKDPKYIFTIWDFGSSEILKYSDESKDYVKNKLESNKDLHFLHDLYKRIRVLAITNRYTIDELEDILSENEDDIQYVNRTRAENEKRFTKDRFEEKYKISLAYYIMETDRFQEIYESKKDTSLPKHHKIYLPPKEVDLILKKLSEKYNYDYKEAISKSGPTTRKIPNPKELINIFLPEYRDPVECIMTFTS